MARDDARENQFYSTQSADSQALPLDIGGAFIYQTGIAGRASDYLGGYVMEWDIEFRGLRLSDNVTLRSDLRVVEAPINIPPRPKLTIDDVVVLDGKEYIRVGEAKNPGPETSESEGDDDDEDCFGSLTFLSP
jgi:hypothetical protein